MFVWAMSSGRDTGVGCQHQLVSGSCQRQEWVRLIVMERLVESDID